MAKLHIWSPDEAKKNLKQRLSNAKMRRREIEREWEENERALSNTRGGSMRNDINFTLDANIASGITDVDSSDVDTGTNYVFKNMRLIHSQLSANPPSVIPRPTSGDPSDRRKADAADRLIRYGMRQYSLQERFDLVNLQNLYYGTAYLITDYDSEAGDVLEFNEETNEVSMEGDIRFKVPSTWAVFLDADATSEDTLNHFFEELTIPFEEAAYRFPDKLDLLKKERLQNGGSDVEENSYNSRNRKFDSVRIYEYWEKGLPYNGMIGRHCFCMEDGELLTPVKPNPFRFKAPKDRGLEGVDTITDNTPGKARLPIHIITDLDVPNSVYGRAVTAYSTALQDALNRMDNATLDILQAHGVARLMLPEGSEIADDSITNSSWDVIKYTGNQPPSFMEPMPLPAALPAIRESMKMGIDDMWGVNESMFGQQSRETAGFAMQYATNQGNMIRRRLFNKYVKLTESVYKAYLDLVRKHWTEGRTICVLGKEKAFEAVDIKGADIDGGFDFVVEYGTSLSLDPLTRREEILTLVPLFEKAGVQPRTMLSMLKLNELEGMYDRLQLAADRQREYFQEMIDTGLYLPPEELEDHPNMLAFGYDYIMTSEFKYLEDEGKALVRQHIKEREQLAAQGAAGAAGAGAPPAEGAPAGAMPLPGAMPPAAAGMTGAPAGVENTGSMPGAAGTGTGLLQ